MVMKLRKGAFSLLVVHDQYGNTILFVARELRMYHVTIGQRINFHFVMQCKFTLI